MRWVAWVVIGLVTVAWGDGCMVPLRVSLAESTATLSEDRQRAGIVCAGGVEQLILSVSATGRAREAAWLVPVPASVTAQNVELSTPQALAALFGPTEPLRSREVDSADDPARKGPLCFLAPPTIWAREFRRINPFVRHVVDAAVELPAPPAATPTTSVTVIDSFERGPYHLELLAATGGTELVAWLQAHGYAVPDRLSALADEYLRAGRRFVAMRLSGVGDGPVASDLPPLALTFAASQPWFPLRISQATAPDRAIVEIVVAAPQPVRCADAPERSLNRGGWFRRGSLAQQRRRAARAMGYAGLVREAVQPLHRPDGGLTWEGPEELWLTRYWSLFARSAMADLRFEPLPPNVPESTWRAAESGRGSTAPPLWQRLVGSPWGPLLLVIGLTALFGQPDPRRRVADPPPRRRCLDALTSLAVLLLAAITALELVVARGGDTGPGRGVEWAGTSAAVLLVLRCVVVLAGVLPAAVLALAERAGESVRARLGWLLVTGLAIGVGALAIDDGDSTHPWLTANGVLLLALWTAVVAASLAYGGALWARQPRHRHLPFALWAALLCGYMVAGELGVTYREALAGQRLPSPDESCEPLLSAVKQFRHDHGAWPLQLRDLTATSLPATGLDTAGNVVPLPPTPWHRYLEELPPEPISGGLRSWRYDPSDELVVDAQWRFD